MSLRKCTLTQQQDTATYLLECQNLEDQMMVRMQKKELSFIAGGNANDTATLEDSSYKTKHTCNI